MRSQVRRALLLLRRSINLGSGYAPCAPYNVIHVTKVVEEIPLLLLTQLASPGRMVIPVRTDSDRHDVMIQIDKDAAGDVSQKELPDLL
jgi:protein-L-isoaspartate(D-aspartate) O-methyltransferase